MVSTGMQDLTPSESILNQLMEIARISALAEMASGIAHELNQPLGAIATFSQAGDRLLNRPEPLVAQALEVFRQINAAALGAGEGIRRIRRLFDHQGANHTPSRMSTLIEELRPLFAVLATHIHADLTIEVDPAMPELMVDRLRIQHVLFALVQNAFDASAQGSGAPRVKVETHADRYAVETSVTDSGPGVTAAVDEQLFRPFFTTKAQGTGLGLASARAIIEAHGGTIGFENMGTGGSRFWFRLPRAEPLAE
jgi:C4-dicarboxylate-specific signal transduction histidine kinase